MSKIIKKAGQALTIAAIKSGDFSKIDKINEKAKKEAAEVFQAVASGVIRVAWYDMPPVICASGAVSVMRHALHRSTRSGDLLQLSTLEIKGGAVLPWSHCDLDIKGGAGEFFQRLPSEVNINFIN